MTCDKCFQDCDPLVRVMTMDPYGPHEEYWCMECLNEAEKPTWDRAEDGTPLDEYPHQERIG